MLLTILREYRLRISGCREQDLRVLEKLYPQYDHNEIFSSQRRGEGLYLLARKADLPVGMIMVNWEGSEIPHLKNQTRPFVRSLFVHSDFRRHGVARRLLLLSEGELIRRGYREVGLAVGVENDIARKLYESLGYSYSDLGEFLDFWKDVGPNGLLVFNEKICLYMLKRLQ